MVLHVLRALFILLMAAAGWFYLSNGTPEGLQTAIGGENSWLVLPITLTIGVLFVCVDILSPRRKLAIFSGTILGLLVGAAVAYGLSFVVQFVIDQFKDANPHALLNEQYVALAYFVKSIVGIVCSYLAISFILQTKDDFRFIIPYVEFAKQSKGAKPIILDTSVLIDGRIADIAATGVMEERMIVPNFVLEELQAVADSADKLKRNRGRRGLDVLARLRSDKQLDVILYESQRFDTQDSTETVDQKLVRLAKELNGRVVTNDHNLNKVAKVSNVDVININDLSQALKPVILPGESMTVHISRAGEEPGQGVGYLEDGTMVVVEHARQFQGEDIEFTVTRAHQTSAGRMIFGRPTDEGVPSRRSRGQSDAPSARS
jgi:uncharacterized protein YacL